MLIKCPECELQASDKALSCPHCGYPFVEAPAKKPKSRKNKRRRLPNGFGQITEIKNQFLRKPFRAMVTVGKTPEGKPICKLLKPEAYFETYNEAYAALVAYHKNPYDLEPATTVRELYDKWTNDYFKTLKSSSSRRTVTSAWDYCSSVYNMRAMDLRARHIKGCMDDGTAVRKGEICKTTPNIKARIKSLFNLMLDYALEYEIVDRNYARTFDISDDIIRERDEATRGHIPFTDEEIAKIIEAVGTVPYADVVLFQCFSGFRPQELGLIEISNVDLKNRTIVGGMKSEAGTDRLVPIHSFVYSIVEQRYNEAITIGSKYLINCTDTHTHRSSHKMTYDKYQTRFDKVCERLKLNPEHRPHDPRKHFVTMAKKADLDEYAIKYIVGHKISDITEKIYTERDDAWLKAEMEKIKSP